MASTDDCFYGLYSETIPVKILCAFSSEGKTLEDLKQHFLDLASYVSELQTKEFELVEEQDPTWITICHKDFNVFKEYFSWTEIEEEDEEGQN